MYKLNFISYYCLDSFQNYISYEYTIFIDFILEKLLLSY